jgi:hypothetical protein
VVDVVLAFDGDKAGLERTEASIRNRYPRPRYQPDWELEAELEFWRSLQVEAISEPTLAWTQALIQETEATLAERRRKDYRRANAPYDFEALVKRVKERADLVAVFGTRAPASMMRASAMQRRQVHICCPFHQEREPSLCIYVDQQSWWCFGCRQGGDVISAVMLFEGLDFWPALQMLASEFGVDLPKPRGTRPVWEAYSA